MRRQLSIQCSRIYEKLLILYFEHARGVQPPSVISALSVIITDKVKFVTVYVLKKMAYEPLSVFVPLNVYYLGR